MRTTFTKQQVGAIIASLLAITAMLLIVMVFDQKPVSWWLIGVIVLHLTAMHGLDDASRRKDAYRVSSFGVVSASIAVTLTAGGYVPFMGILGYIMYRAIVANLE